MERILMEMSEKNKLFLKGHKEVISFSLPWTLFYMGAMLTMAMGILPP